MFEPIMPVTIVINVESSTSESRLLWFLIFILFISHLSQVWELFEDFLEGFSLWSLHYSLLDLRICIICTNATIEMFEGFYLAHGVSIIFSIRIRKYKYEIPLVLVNFYLCLIINNRLFLLFLVFEARTKISSAYWA